MIRNLLATTAVATLIATGAWAQSSTTTSPTMPTQAAPEQPMVKKAEGELASNFIGESVYNGSGDDADNIGEVNDLVLNPDGTVKAVVIGVGGFLGIGQKDVAIEYDLVKWVERDNDRFLVVETTAEALKAQEEFDKAAYEPAPADSDVAETKPATKEDLESAEQQASAEQPAEQPADQQQSAQSGTTTTTTTTPPAAAPSDSASQDQASNMESQDKPASQEQASSTESQDKPASQEQASSTESQDKPASQDQASNMESQDKPASQEQAQQSTTTTTTTTAETDTNAAATDTTTTGAVDRAQLKPLQSGEIGTDEFVGTTVYGADDETIGEIGEVILTQDGKVDAVLIDVGGFLGIGEKQVAVGMDNLQFMIDNDGNRYLYTGFTKEQLESAPEYDESQWAQNRDEMKVAVPN